MTQLSKRYRGMALALGVLVATAMWADSNSTEIRLRTLLSGGAIGGKTPSGNADFRSEAARNRSRLNVEVENVNLPDGTVLTVFVSHGAAVMVGQIHLRAGFGEMELNSQDGDSVPTIVKGDMVTVNNGATVILTGVF
jgi:acetamidase/formamidase